MGENQLVDDLLAISNVPDESALRAKMSDIALYDQDFKSCGQTYWDLLLRMAVQEIIISIENRLEQIWNNRRVSMTRAEFAEMSDLSQQRDMWDQFLVDYTAKYRKRLEETDKLFRQQNTILARVRDAKSISEYSNAMNDLEKVNKEIERVAPTRESIDKMRLYCERTNNLLRSRISELQRSDAESRIRISALTEHYNTLTDDMRKIVQYLRTSGALDDAEVKDHIDLIAGDAYRKYSNIENRKESMLKRIKESKAREPEKLDKYALNRMFLRQQSESTARKRRVHAEVKAEEASLRRDSASEALVPSAPRLVNDDVAASIVALISEAAAAVPVAPPLPGSIPTAPPLVRVPAAPPVARVPAAPPVARVAVAPPAGGIPAAPPLNTVPVAPPLPSSTWSTSDEDDSKLPRPEAQRRELDAILTRWFNENLPKNDIAMRRYFYVDESKKADIKAQIRARNNEIGRRVSDAASTYLSPSYSVTPSTAEQELKAIRGLYSVYKSYLNGLKFTGERESYQRALRDAMDLENVFNNIKKMLPADSRMRDYSFDISALELRD